MSRTTSSLVGRESRQPLRFPVVSVFSALLSGFAFALSLIVVIGAQNPFVLRQGLLGRHVSVVVGICLVSDALLIAAGIAGVGAALERAPALLTLLTIGGAAFLTTYGLIAARRALRPTSVVVESHDVRTSIVVTAMTCLAITWLNPHVYLDTVVLLGSVANAREGSRWWFGTGAVMASTCWFVALGFGARWLRPLFARPRAWQLLDAVIAVVLLAIAATLTVQLV
jgi:L-lysine exporter family protein LysE/ArgO